MSTNTKLAEALRLAREWFRHEEAGEGPQADDVIKAADEAIAAHDAEQAAKAVPAGLYVGLIERLMRLSTRLGIAYEGGVEHFAASLEDRLYAICRSAENMLDSAAPAAPAPEAQDSARTSPAHQPVHGWTDADADAARLALELECLLTDGDVPMPVTSRWWESAHEALALHRQRLESELSETRANVDKAPAAQSATVEEWERELSAVMPLDFKDWWQNDRHEWPAVAAAVIRSQRADCELGWKMAAEAAPSAEPLTDDDAYEIASEFFSQPWYRRVATEVVRATERAHGIGGATTGEQ